MQCKNCGKICSDTAQFCIYCGAGLDTKKTVQNPVDAKPSTPVPPHEEVTATHCKNCGKTCSNTAQFCIFCGARLDIKTTLRNPARAEYRAPASQGRFQALLRKRWPILLCAVLVIAVPVGIAVHANRKDDPSDSKYHTESSSAGSKDHTGNTDNTNYNKRTQLVEPLSIQNPALDRNSLEVQDIVAFCGGALEYSELSVSGSYYVRELTGKRDQYHIYESFVKALNSQPNLTHWDDYYSEIRSDYIVFSDGFNYIGDRSVPETTRVNFTDSYASIAIYGVIKGDSLTISVWIPNSMEITDLGKRAFGETVTVEPVGASALAGLDIIGNTTFETSDGRLRTELGEATILREGNTYTARVEHINENNRDDIIIRNYHGIETLAFGFPEKMQSVGDIYELPFFADGMTYSLNEKTFTEPSSYRWSQFFECYYNGRFHLLHDHSSSVFDRVTVRLMYMREDVAAVYYVCATFQYTEQTIEALIAANLSEAFMSEQDKKLTYTISVRQDATLVCKSEYMPLSELYDWEITSGSDVVTLSNTNQRECVVHGVKSGSATVKATYTWTTYEPDVLTGNPVYKRHSRTTVYTINVT